MTTKNKVLTQNNFLNKIYKFFGLDKYNTNIRTELIAGLTTFLTCTYVIAVNPVILAESGMDAKAVFYATAMAAGLSTLFVGIWANLPFALAPAMGLNAYFSFYVVRQLGLTWQNALVCVFISGIIFILMSFIGLQQKIVDSMPDCIKNSVGAGIGFFIAFTGFMQSGIITSSPDTLVKLGDMSNPGAILALLGLVLIVYLTIKGIKGGILIGIIAVTICGMFFVNPATGQPFTVLPSSLVSLENPFRALEPTLFKLSLSGMFTGDSKMILGTIFAIISFLFVDLFNSIGVLLGVATKAGMVDENGNIPSAGKALFVSAAGAAGGALLGTSTVSIYGAESTTGIAEGGRTGLTAVFTGIFFLLAMFLSPLFLIIPSIATAPALIMVGIFMIEPLCRMDLGDLTVAVPVFLTVAVMPFAYDIAYGILLGLLGYSVAHIAKGTFKTEVNKTVKILTVIFLAYFILNMFA